MTPRNRLSTLRAAGLRAAAIRNDVAAQRAAALATKGAKRFAATLAAQSAADWAEGR